MQPSPMAETSRLLFPSLRFCIFLMSFADAPESFRREWNMGHRTRRFSRDHAQPVAFLRKKRVGPTSRCGTRRHANHTPEDLSKMARARVSDFESNLDDAARRFADELLGASDPLSPNELQRRHPRCLFEDARKVERTKFHQSGQCLDRNVLSEPLAYVVLHFAKLSDRQTAAEVALFRSGVCVFLDEIPSEKLCESSDALRLSWRAHRKHFGACKAQMRERFVPSEKVNHVHLASRAGIHRFQGRKKLIHGKVDNDVVELFPGRRPPTQLVGNL